ncbi:thiamine pyrophosphate-binding protein [Rugosimonospora africana]|uniref:Benzoylformate decarboxylase n=1 Tax=Rugosimonospora africana TaxID=556532 RepID=A0A8J3QTG5_9ACTN|nr:thiamine pyrophosphate-binding protein [Rugosimonospora africana]GIH15338.1 benzoylformate decarboxylase [Rugosimonospora africana]
MTRPDRTVAGALLDLVADWGVNRLFTCPGSTEAAVLDAMVDRDDLDLVLTTHEGVTVSMADGLARATGAPSLAYLHANVGLSNGLANLYAAQLAYSPVVVLNGLKPATIQARSGFTTARRTRDLVGQFVKDDWQSLTSDTVVEDVNRAFTLAVAEPAGPVWVGLSQDLLDRPADAPQPNVSAHRVDTRVAPSRAALDSAARLLRQAQAPVLIAGSEVGRAGAVPAMVALAQRLGAPVFMEERRSFERPGFPTGHPNYRGDYDVNHPLVQQADVLFFVGGRVFHEFEPAKRPSLPPGATVVHSHPDAQQIGRIYGVDAGLVGDPRLVLEALAELLGVDADRPAPPPVPAAEVPPADPDARYLRPVDAVLAVTEALSGSTLVGDVTTAGGLLQRYADKPTGESFFVSSSGSLGWGMGAALGVQLGQPGRHVAAILGDGVFQFGVPALWTAAYYRIPVTFVVLNNQRYAAVGAALRRFGGRAVQTHEYPGTDLAGPRIAEVSTGFGVPGVRVTGLADLRDELRSARSADGPALIEVMTDPDDFGP